MSYVFAVPPQVVVPVVGTTDLFPVHRIYCVGRNYVEHAQEMGFSGREPPCFFAKPADAVAPVAAGAVGRVPFPDETEDFQHEVELVVAIGRRGRRIAVAEAAAYVWGYAVGVDLTRRDLQSRMKKLGLPWEVGKSFDASAPVSPVRPAVGGEALASGRIWLGVNGAARQDSDLSKLIWNVAEIIAHLSRYFELVPGDLVFTGTPAGVAAMQPGDRVDAGIDGVGTLSFVLER
ncbi:MAG TPA: fumarylacetoacetate hydrolase family protein [Burkholderiaceae bacterium]|nr:fumarylacetoacetate hydrolase family protein [Burkholderiaceae bacterium]